MNRSLLIIISFLLISNSLSSQNKNFQFGKIEEWEKNLKVYEKDKDAEAVVLYDFGMSYFVKQDNGFNLIFERTRRIKILSEAGLEYSEVEIPLYQEGKIYETVESLKASTHNYDGESRVVKNVDPESCYTEKINDSWMNMKFAFPDVKVGSIIEYTYKLKSESIFNLRDWEYQSDIPTIYSEYITKMIPFYEFRWVLQGATRFDEFESFIDQGSNKSFGLVEYKDMVYRYIMKDVPSFKDEEYLSSRDDYILKLDFQLAKIISTDGAERSIMTTWEELSKALLKNEFFGKYIKKCESGADKIVNIESYLNIPEAERIKGITREVKERFSWNNYYSKYANQSFKELLKSKRGNVGDINLMLIGVLRAAGVNAKPIILSTRDNGKIKVDYPFSQFFNYVLVLVENNGEYILIDATEAYADHTLLPPRCINGNGLIVEKGDTEWFNISHSSVSVEQISIVSTFLEDSETFGSQISIESNSYDALRLRKAIGDNKEKVVDYYDSDLMTTVKDSTSIINLNSPDKPFKIELYQEGKTELIRDKIYFSPFLEMSMDENPFKLKERRYPIEMIYPYTEVYTSEIEIPVGYEIDYLPESKEHNNSLFKLTFAASSNDQKVQTSLSFSFAKSTYSSKDYLKLKTYFNMIVNCGAEKIVFKKKTSTE